MQCKIKRRSLRETFSKTTQQHVFVFCFHVVEICNADEFTARCASNEVVLMTSAVYGRMRVGRCVTQSDYVGCWNDALAAFDARCSGRQSCQVEVRSDLWREEENSCVEYAHGYVEASFECFEGDKRNLNPFKSRKCEFGCCFQCPV